MKPAIDFVTTNKSKVTIVGTTNVISDKMYNAANGTSRVDGGTDRFDTNLKVLAAFSTILNFNKVYIANASNDGYADALVASAVAGKTGVPLVLLDSQTSQATANAIAYIKTNIPKTSDLNVIGGTGVVTNDTVDLINGKVSFKDKNLEEAVRDSINKPVGTLYKSDVEKITELSAKDRGITDISGIENLTNLQQLDLPCNQISDINALKNLTNLQKVDLTGNQISDISLLSGLTNLQTLNLGYNPWNGWIPASKQNQISDISSLKGLTNLQNLSLNGNHINDISPLKELTNLQQLNLSENQISDISSLEALTSLQKLDLAYNQISDISVLKGLTNLQTLDLSSTQVKDISVLQKFSNLQTLNLAHNQINDINSLKGGLSVLSGLTNLQTLDLGYNRISDINSLKGLTNLQQLDLVGNKISDDDKQLLQYVLPQCHINYSVIYY